MVDEHWLPKLTRIDDPVAEDDWEYVTSEGKRRVTRVQVGHPVPWPKAGAWYCPVKIEGHTMPAVQTILGRGPVEALMNAMTQVTRFFESHVDIVPGAKPKRGRGGTPSNRKRAAGQPIRKQVRAKG